MSSEPAGNCRARPGAPVLTAGADRYTRGPEDFEFPGDARLFEGREWVKVTWEPPPQDPGWTGDCRIIQQRARSVGIFNGDYITGGPVGGSVRAMDALFPHSGLTRPTQVRVSARNQLGWGPYTQILLFPDSDCDRPPGPVANLRYDPNVTPGTWMNTGGWGAWSDPFGRMLYDTITTEAGRGGPNCNILWYETSFEHRLLSHLETEHYFGDGHPSWGSVHLGVTLERPVDQPTPERGNVTFRVRAVNQAGEGPWTQHTLAADGGCTGPPVAPVLVWDHVYDGPAWTKLATVADMGGEGCAVVRYDTEYQHQSTTFADTYLAFLPDDPWFGRSNRQFRAIGEPTGATGHITYRVRAVNHRDGGTSTTPRSQPREVRV